MNNITEITASYKGLKRVQNGDYVYTGDIIVDGHLEIDLDGRLIVTGSIKAGDGIKAGWGIEAGWGIKAGDFISSTKRIFAGISLYRTSTDCDKTIKCKELRSGEIAYGDLQIIKPEPKNTCDDCIHKPVCTHVGTCDHFMEK